MLLHAEPRGSSDGRRRQDRNVDYIHPSSVSSALNRFLALSVEPRSVGGRRCGSVSSAYREIRCDTFVQSYQFNNPLREENDLVYLRFPCDFRRLSAGWIVVVVVVVPLHWLAVWEVGSGHTDPLRDSPVKRGLTLPTLWMKTTRP